MASAETETLRATAYEGGTKEGEHVEVDNGDLASLIAQADEAFPDTSVVVIVQGEDIINGEERTRYPNIRGRMSGRLVMMRIPEGTSAVWKTRQFP